jgi:hypothetical protein
MPSATRKHFAVHPHDRQGTWESNDGRYRAYAHELLGELDTLCAEVLAKWPVDVSAAITDENTQPELWKLARLRDRTSDAVRIYAAMALEGFLNFYGVLRLGQVVFDEHFERLGLIPKLRKLLLVCDHLEIAKNDVLCDHLDKVAQSRNALVHAKTKEVIGDPSNHHRGSTKIPEVARESVENMEAFFAAFIAAVPGSEFHVQRGRMG